MASAVLENLRLRDKFLCQQMIRLRYDLSPDHIRYVLQEIRELLSENPKVEDSTARVRFIRFAEYALEVEIYCYILERDYEFSQASSPGGTINNLFPHPDLSIKGPYAMCGKCHDLNNIVSNASWPQHGDHINTGFSCSVCHTAHGMGARSGTISGERLVNFDLGVVGENDTSKAPISYTRGTGTCTLKCHNVDHNADGSVGSSRVKGPAKGVH
jgi:hypothetical protein